MRVIGLTGGIATGKSTVASILRKSFDVPVVDADQASRDVLRPGRPAYREVVACFGEGILLPDGQVNRAALRELIIADAAARKKLESITHPAIRSHIGEQLIGLTQEGHKFAVVEAALLVETGSWRSYQGLIVVSCSRETQIARVMRRDGQSRTQAEQIIATQFPLEKKEAVASVVIRNDGSKEELLQATRDSWDHLISNGPDF